jgi:hypothetical protein
MLRGRKREAIRGIGVTGVWIFLIWLGLTAIDHERDSSFSALPALSAGASSWRSTSKTSRSRLRAPSGDRNPRDSVSRGSPARVARRGRHH